MVIVYFYNNNNNNNNNNIIIIIIIIIIKREVAWVRFVQPECSVSLGKTSNQNFCWMGSTQVYRNNNNNNNKNTDEMVEHTC